MKTFAKHFVLTLAVIVALGASQALAGNPGQFQSQFGPSQFQGQMGYPPVYTPNYNVNRNYNINQNINVNRNYNVNRTYTHRHYTPTYRVYVRPRYQTVCYW